MNVTPARTTRRPKVRPTYLLIGILAGLVVGTGSFALTRALAPRRTNPIYDPPVLAGQLAPEHCSGGFYARHGRDIVLTASAHCGEEGQTVTAPDGSRFGVIGARAVLSPCPHPERFCSGTDINYIIIEPKHIPWGHLNEVDFGVGGYRLIAPETKALTCDDIKLGDKVELNGNLLFRTGVVLDKSANDFPDDTYFPCIVVSSIGAQIGDSGGAVLVNGLPGGISARRFGVNNNLGFTPLPLGLAELGLELCTTPDCGLTPPGG
jgi:hypothetical protein